MVKLFLASLFTLGLMFTLLLSIFAAVAFILGLINIYFLLGFTIFIIFITWLLGPYFNDIILRVFYKMHFIGLHELEPSIAEFIKDLCRRNKISLPKIGFIQDDNPQAFTYGSDHWNARIIITQGIKTYLNEDEIQAVFAHEIGHIVHRDFIIMTIATLIVELLYQIYIIFREASTSPKSSHDDDGGSLLLIIAVVSYVFYIISSYLLLFLSRLREYFADEFAAVSGKANQLTTALIKIAFGIIHIAGQKKSYKLLETTRELGISDFKVAKRFGITYFNYQKSKDPEVLDSAIAYDLNSPWAFFLELSSSHPLTGKRLISLADIATNQGIKPIINSQKIRSLQIDKGKLWRNFFLDLFFDYLPLIGGVIAFVLGFYLFYPISTLALTFKLIITGLKLIPIILIGVGLGLLINASYKFPSLSKKVRTTVTNMMKNIYVSPIRGTPVSLKGKIVGRGIPGLIFSEDLLIDDGTGIIVLDYESIIPVLGNLVFSLKRVEKLIGENVSVDGWFVRGFGHKVILSSISNKQKINSSQRIWAYLSGIVLIGIGIFWPWIMKLLF